MIDQPEEILHYWFGEQEDGFPVEDKNSLWWSASADIDAELRSRFGGILNEARSGHLDGWKNSPRPCLALVVLLDQISRNVFRGKAAAFECDPAARAATLHGLDEGFDEGFTWSERSFFYTPLEHSEDLADQTRCVQLFEDMHASAPPAAREVIQRNVDFAIEHREIIEQFGRFPHRNEVLGRTPTPQEVEYLDSGAKRFGQ